MLDTTPLDKAEIDKLQRIPEADIMRWCGIPTQVRADIVLGAVLKKAAVLLRTGFLPKETYANIILTNPWRPGIINMLTIMRRVLQLSQPSQLPYIGNV